MSIIIQLYYGMFAAIAMVIAIVALGTSCNLSSVFFWMCMSVSTGLLATSDWARCAQLWKK